MTVPGLREGGWVDRDGLGGSRSSFTLGAHVRAPASRSKFQGRRGEGGAHGEAAGCTPGAPSAAGGLWSGGQSHASIGA